MAEVKVTLLGEDKSQPIDAALGRIKNAVASVKTAVDGITGRAFDSVSTGADAAGQHIVNLTDKVNRAGQGSSVVGRNYVDMGNKIVTVGESANRTGQQVHEMGNKGKSASDGIKQVGTSSTATKSAVDGLNNTFTMLKGAIASMGIVAAVKEIAQAGMEAERLRNAINAATGSVEAGAAEMAYVRSEAERLGLEIVSTADSYSKLTASARGTALEGQATRDIFTAVAQASTVLGLSAEQTNGALYSIAQMMSKGNVQAEELRGQLGERLPGAFNLAAKAMNMTTGELNKALENGEVLATDLLPKLAEELHKTYGSQLEDAVKSTRAEVNRMKNSFFELKVMLGEGDAFKKLASTAASVVDGLKTVVKWIGQAKVYWQAFGQTVGASWEGLKGIFRGDKNAVAEMKAQFEAIDQKAQFYWDKWEERSSKSAVVAPPVNSPSPAPPSKLDIKELTKQYKERAKEIIQIEKERIKALEDLEQEHLKKLKSTYQQQVAELDKFADAMKEVYQSRAARSKAVIDAARGEEDPLAKQTRLIQELAEEEQKLMESWADPAAKVKGLNELIPKYRDLFKQIEYGKDVVVSQAEADRNFAIVEERINTAIDNVADGMKDKADAAVKTATAMIESERRIKSYHEQLSTLDDILRRIPNTKTIDVTVNISNIQDLYRVQSLMGGNPTSGIVSYGGYYTQGGKTFWNDGSLADDGTSFVGSIPGAATGGHIIKGGLVRVHDNEDIVPAKIDRSGLRNQGTSVTFGDINVNLPPGTPQQNARETARAIYGELQKLGMRFA